MTYDTNRTDQSGQPANVLIVEAEVWERERLQSLCREHCRVTDFDRRLQDLADQDIPENVRVLSPFIHSRVTAEQMARLDDLELIATRSTGYDHIDLDACDEHGVTVCNVPEYGSNTVAEHAFALLLAISRKIHHAYDRTIRGDFSLAGLRGFDLQGRTFGALGTGSIARNALRIAGGFDMHRIAYDIEPDEQAAAEMGFEYVSFDELLSRSDVLSIHVPYNKHTHHLIDGEAIAKMPAGAILINTARGGIVEPQALLRALTSKHLGGAALDVLEEETSIGEEAELLSRAYNEDQLRTVVQNHALLRLPNVIITPHVGFNSEQAVQRIIETTVENIHAYLAGEPRNVVFAPEQAPAS